jgi:Mg2+ and Co2+ transporter CorA
MPRHGGGPGTRHSLRRFYDMNARELNEIDRDILEIRQYVEHQRDVIRQLATGGQSQAIPEAQKGLEDLQVKLEALLARRKAILQDIRRPRASSIASDPDGSDRQSGGA